MGGSSRIIAQSSWNRRMRPAWRCRSMKKSGEKCQMASFGHTSPQPAACEAAAHREGERDGLAGDERRNAEERADDGAGVGPGDETGEERSRQRQVGRVVAEQQPRRHAPRQRDSEGEREDEPLPPCALLGQQDPPELAEPHQHRGQRGHDRELDDQRRQQDLGCESGVWHDPTILVGVGRAGGGWGVGGAGRTVGGQGAADGSAEYRWRRSAVGPILRSCVRSGARRRIILLRRWLRRAIVLRRFEGWQPFDFAVRQEPTRAQRCDARAV